MSPKLLKQISTIEKDLKESIKRAQRELFVMETLRSLHEIESGKGKKFKSADAAFKALMK